MKVYLAGPMHRQSDADCKGWRSVAATALGLAGHAVLDPMSRDYRGSEDDNADDIVQRDLEDIEQCDVVLVNACFPSWGTAMELVYAKQYGKQIVAYSHAPSISPWLRYHTDAVFSDLSLAIDGIVSGSSIGMR